MTLIHSNHRTNASYSRYQEARRSFGAITTITRDLARQVLAWFPEHAKEGRSVVLRWLVAMARSSMVRRGCHTRGRGGRAA